MGRFKKTVSPKSELALEIMENILLRLPVKSVIRFKCVCKAWHTLISDPYFAKTHLRLPQTQARSRFCIIEDGERDEHNYMVIRAFTEDCEAFSDETGGGSLAFDYLSDIGNFKHEVVLLDSCDGLLCIVDLGGKIVLWNPSTRQYYQLPRNPDIREGCGCYGFGYVASSDDYRVVVATSVINIYSTLLVDYKTRVDVFSLKSNKWKRIQKEEEQDTGLIKYATFLHGAAHWIAYYNKPYEDPRIVAFDLEKEQFREMAMPNDEEYLKVRVVGGCLCLNGYNDPSKMWVMKQYGIDTSWTKITAPYTSILRRSSDIMNQQFYNCELLHTLNDDLLLLFNLQKLTLYDQKKNTYKHLYEKRMWYEYDYDIDHASLYVETLVSPHPQL